MKPFAAQQNASPRLDETPRVGYFRWVV